MSEQKKYELTERDLEIIDELKHMEAASGKSARQFAAEHLTYSETVWARVQTGEYFQMVADPEKVMTSLERDLGRYHREQAMAARYVSTGWRHTVESRACFKAVEACRAKPQTDQHRLVMYLAPTGGGKSQLCAQARAKHDARVVEARQSWQINYFSCVKDIAVALSLGGKIEGVTTPDEIEDKIQEKLREKKITLAIDEGEYFAARTLNLLKLLLNKTNCTILLCVDPEAYEKWTRENRHQARQIRRRTHAIIKLAPIEPATAGEFMGDLEVDKADADGVRVVLAKFANSFGHFDMLCQMVEGLRERRVVNANEAIKVGNAIRADWDLPLLNFERVAAEKGSGK